MLWIILLFSDEHITTQQYDNLMKAIVNSRQRQEGILNSHLFIILTSGKTTHLFQMYGLSVHTKVCFLPVGRNQL